MIRVGSCFSGIGGFEIGIEAAFGDSVKTVWQVEKDSFCQKVLKKHWPNTLLLDDVKKVNKNTVPPIDMLIGGFPCQSISVAGNREGLENEEKSGLWWEMFRIIGDLRPRIVVLENVSNVIRLGGSAVVGSLASIGYNLEWKIVRASDFGAPHRRARWFCVAYSNRKRSTQQPLHSVTMGKSRIIERRSGKNARIHKRHDWKRFPVESPLCRGNDGISYRLDRIKALGNAIVPACSEYVGRCILNSGLVDDLLENDK